jgi:hypothetical protein
MFCFIWALGNPCEVGVIPFLLHSFLAKRVPTWKSAGYGAGPGLHLMKPQRVRQGGPFQASVALAVLQCSGLCSPV